MTWLCNARKETGESTASQDFAHTCTTLSPVRRIFLREQVDSNVVWSANQQLTAGERKQTGKRVTKQNKEYVSER